MFYVIAVKRCRRPRIRQHQEVTWSGINVGDTAEFTCHAEYTLPEGGVARTVVCQPSGQWSASPKCTGNSISSFHMYINGIYETKVLYKLTCFFIHVCFFVTEHVVPVMPDMATYNVYSQPTKLYILIF